jgi:hypothetical protein
MLQSVGDPDRTAFDEWLHNEETVSCENLKIFAVRYFRRSVGGPLASRTHSTRNAKKKRENYARTVAIFYLYYNFCRAHHTMSVTPACKLASATTFVRLKNW